MRVRAAYYSLAVGFVGIALATSTSHQSASTLPVLSMQNAQVTEGNQVVSAQITATLSAPSDTPVTARYASRNGTAVAPDDYTKVTGTVTFDPGVTQATIAVPIQPDSVDGGTERFGVALSNPSGATIGKSTAAVTIVQGP